MDVSSTGLSSQVYDGGGLIQVLETAQKSQAEMVEKLISVTLEQTASYDKMEIAGQIIDVYA